MSRVENEEPRRQATLSDVARQAGTSVATVSRVLNNTDYPVSNDTRQRVLNAANALRYTPNLLGRMLKTGSARSLGIIIPSFQNPFFIQLVMGIEHAAHERNYTTFVFSAQRSASIERRMIQQIMNLRIPGLLLSSMDKDSAMLLRFLNQGGKAALFEAEYAPPSDVIDATASMDENGYLATSFLLDRGHTHLALLTTPMTRHNRQMVARGFHEALLSRGIPFGAHCVFESQQERELDDGLFEFEAGKSLARRLLESGQPITGIVAINDLLACGVIQGLTQAGNRIPEDFSVVGIDDIPQSAMLSPALTTVNQESYQHGYEACLHLIDLLEDPQHSLPVRCYHMPRMVQRQSVRALGD